jgi:acetyl-CoA carboxylase biotin carboxyl carrier protein
VRFGARRRPSPLAPDPELIRTLADLLTQNGLTEIEYAVGDRLVRVSRRTSALPVATGHTINTAPAAPQPSDGTAPPSGNPGAVTAPMVGTVYLAPQPGAPAFVHLGEMVETGRTLLIIEAMKVMNEIRAPRAGRVARILVEDTQPVEYGEPLMVIE